MDIIKLKASAKINLSLDVTGKRKDGYHLIKSVFQSIGIYDILTVKKEIDGIKITCDDKSVPCDSRNIVYKASQLFFENTGIDGGVSIHIEKHIPSQAGLGGGSSDGAAVLCALNRLYETNMNIAELGEIGGRISADTAFFIYGGTAYVKGIGEQIMAIRSLPPINLVIAKGSAGISTPEAYKAIDSLVKPHHPDIKGLLKAIDKGKFLKNCRLCENIFELVTTTQDVFNLKKLMLDFNAQVSVMSGSGSSVFGIFEEKDDALKCAENLKKAGFYAEYCTAVTQGIYEF